METKNDFIYTDWMLIENQFNPEELQTRETIFTIGNGYLGTRGSFEEGYPQALSATLIHGVYDDVPVVYTELANCPDWLPLVVIIDGDRFRLDQGKILKYNRELDLHQGVLRRSVRWCSPIGKTIDIRFERFASLADHHVLAQICTLTALDFHGLVEIQASINGYPENKGFNHWEGLDQGKIDRGFWLHSRTRTSRIHLGMAAKITVSGIEAALQVNTAPGYPSINATFFCEPQQTVTVEKIVTVFTSQDVSEPVSAAQEKLSRLDNYISLHDANQQAWAEIWQQSDITIEGDSKAAFAVRYNLFQLLIAGSHQNETVSIPAKTLSGFGYHGHIFWDTEIFILPFFTFTQPEIARNLLTYRYHTLNGARRKAGHYGYQGAMYAWESAVTGDEVTPRWSLLNDYYAEDVRIWCRDREIHISSVIPYAIWYYWRVTGDDEWLKDYGAEIIFDTAIFWSSRVELNPLTQHYEIRSVIGTDEYHELVHNNTFTNRMVQWHLEKACTIYDILSSKYPDKIAELEQKLQLSAEMRNHWLKIIDKICILYDSETGLIEQCEGFFQLADLNLADYEPRQKSIQAILGIESTNKHQVLKQPDVLMLIYLMRESAEFPYNRKSLEANWNYYAPRTDITYGSSLAPAIHAILAADLGKTQEAYERFMQAAMVDLEDRRGNTNDGIHGASAGGIWQAVIFGFAGIQFTDTQPVAHPHFPPGWTRLKFKLYWRGRWHDFDLRPISLPSPHPHIQGVIFDLDGVLTDTSEYHYQAWQKLADEEGIPFNRQANEALRGISRRASLMLIIGNRKYSELQIQEMMERKNNYYVELIENITHNNLLPGAVSLLDNLRVAGLKIAIGSASKNAHLVIEKLGIIDKLDVIADGYSVQKPKPAPDLFLFAAQQLGIAPQQCVVFEDAAAGIEAALGAGMWVVGMGQPERLGNAHIILPSLVDLTWEKLQAKFRDFALQNRA
ncbi:beta-phosphoglucomutase [Okeanomitos corallinicola TIOX110]|uniref:Beta-phosphoglucomutase n=1 Tax=Okeanomitos corallinicola TIOX110 TaxID=3133117 RepID=A0ABZ2UXR4_9CYAN